MREFCSHLCMKWDHAPPLFCYPHLYDHKTYKCVHFLVWIIADFNLTVINFIKSLLVINGKSFYMKNTTQHYWSLKHFSGSGGVIKCVFFLQLGNSSWNCNRRNYGVSRFVVETK